MSGPRRPLLVAAVLCAIACLSPAAATATQVPKATGPLPVTATSYPFGAADHQMVPQDLRREGYVENEYFLSGKANVYSWPAPGPAVVRTPNAPYTTRVLVRRPANAQALQRERRRGAAQPDEPVRSEHRLGADAPAAPAQRRRLGGRHGQAGLGRGAEEVRSAALRVAVLRQPAAAERSRATATSPARTAATPRTDWLGTSTARSERGYAATATQPARLRQAPVKHVYGFGYSQTGGYLYDYINAIHPLVVKSDGQAAVRRLPRRGGRRWFVGAVPINQCEPAPPVGDPAPPVQQSRRADHPCDVAVGLPLGHRRPAARQRLAADPYRHYEMAGAGHATPDELILLGRARRTS